MRRNEFNICIKFDSLQAPRMQIDCCLSRPSSLVQFRDKRTLEYLLMPIQCPNPLFSHCYKSKKPLADQSSLLLLISSAFTTIAAGAAGGTIQLYGMLSNWQYLNQSLKISFILEIIGCFSIALTAIVAMSKFLLNLKFQLISF